MLFFHHFAATLAEIRRKEWLLLSFEFVTVLAGIMIAFQLNEWATNRRELARSKELLERLFDETQRNVSWLRIQREDANNLIAREAKFAMALVHDGRCPTDDDLWQSVVTVAWFPPIVVETSVWEEMMGAGGLATIKSSEARRAVSRFHTELAMAKERTNFIRQQSGPAVPIDHPDTNVTFDTGRDDPIAVTFNHADLCRDPAFKKRVADKVRDHNFVLSERSELVRSAIEMCSSLGRMLGNKCKPFRGGALTGEDAKIAEEAWAEAGNS